MLDILDGGVDDGERFAADKLRASLARSSNAEPKGAGNDVFLRRVCSKGRDEALEDGSGVGLGHELDGILKLEEGVVHDWLPSALPRHLSTRTQ